MSKFISVYIIATLLLSSLHTAAGMRYDHTVESMLENDAEVQLAAQTLSNNSQYATLGSPSYKLDMIRLKVNGMQQSFCGLSKDDCTTLDDFPGNKVHNELTWEAVVQELQQVPRRQKAGEIWRGGELGYLLTNNKLWEKDAKVLVLGFSVEQHEFVRPILDKILGPAGEGHTWDKALIYRHVTDFLSERSSFESSSSMLVLVAKILHSVHFAMELTEEEAKNFTSFQQELVPRILAFPRIVVDHFDWPKLQASRDYWLSRYELAMKADTRGVFPTSMTAEQRPILLSAMLDSLLFAGGLSVPGVIQVGLAALHAKESVWVERDSDLRQDGVTESFVMEVIRRFPPVVGFPWWTPDQKRRTVMNIAMALRDKRVWGKDFMEFKLRSQATYKKLGRVAWAEPANGPEAWAVASPGRTGHLTPMSRGCPGQAMSFMIAETFFEEWFKVRTAWGVTEAPKGGITFTDVTPFASVIRLSQLVKKGWVLQETSFLPLLGYKSSRRLAVLHAGSAESPPMLFLFVDEEDSEDDPSKALRIPLKRSTEVKEKSGTEYGLTSDHQCFKVYSSKETRICVTGSGSDSAAVVRDSWLATLNEHIAKTPEDVE